MRTGERSGGIVGVADGHDGERLRSALSSASGTVRLAEPDDVSETVASVDPELVVASVPAPSTLEGILDRVRSRDERVPVIVATPADDDRLAGVAVRGGASDYVRLSDPDELLAAVDRLRREHAAARGASELTESTLELLAASLPEEGYIIDEDGTYLEASVRSDVAALYAVADDELEGRTLFDAFEADVASDLLACVRRAIETGALQTIEYEAETTDGRRCWEGRVNPIDEPVEGRRAVAWLARDVTERVRREESLCQQRDQLETLNRINAVVRGVIRTLVEAPTRTDVERGVCRRLVESDLYCGAWIGERTGEDWIDSRTCVGEAERYLAAISDGDLAAECGAIATGLRTGETVATTGIQDDADVPAAVRDAARADGVDAAVIVPIGHDDTIYGVLAVFARREDAFGDCERSAFGVLGDTIGFAINAVMNRRLLFADAIVELELLIEEGDAFSFEITETYDCTVDLEWAGTTSSGLIHQYVGVDGLDGERALAEARDHDSVESARLIHDGEDGCTLEIRLAESGVRTLTNFGARVREAHVEDGIATVLVEVPRDVDVRQLLETFRTVYEEARLVARREVDREVDTAAQRRERIAEALTDRQRTALRLAYYGGYFDWPRGTTGEEIAEIMEVSPPTMHQHLRSALGRLLTEFFEGGE